MRIKNYVLAVVPFVVLTAATLASAENRTIGAWLTGTGLPENSLAFDCGFGLPRPHIEALAKPIDACGNETSDWNYIANNDGVGTTESVQFDNALAFSEGAACSSAGFNRHRARLVAHRIDTSNGTETFFALSTGPATTCWNSNLNANPPQCTSQTNSVTRSTSSSWQSGTACSNHTFKAYSLGSTP